MCVGKQNPGYVERTLATEEAQDTPGTRRRLTSPYYEILGMWGAGLLGVVISLARRTTAGFESQVLHQNLWELQVILIERRLRLLQHKEILSLRIVKTRSTPCLQGELPPLKRMRAGTRWRGNPKTGTA